MKPGPFAGYRALCPFPAVTCCHTGFQSTISLHTGHIFSSPAAQFHLRNFRLPDPIPTLQANLPGRFHSANAQKRSQSLQRPAAPAAGAQPRACTCDIAFTLEFEVVRRRHSSAWLRISSPGLDPPARGQGQRWARPGAPPCASAAVAAARPGPAPRHRRGLAPAPPLP